MEPRPREIRLAAGDIGLRLTHVGDRFSFSASEVACRTVSCSMRLA
jgi:hypothetical protein